MNDAAPSYWIEVAGDDDKMVAGDIADLIENYYNVRARVAAPLSVKLTIRDAYGATRAGAHTWHPMTQLTVVTASTRDDLDGVRAEVVLGPVETG